MLKESDSKCADVDAVQLKKQRKKRNNPVVCPRIGHPESGIKSAGLDPASF